MEKLLITVTTSKQYDKLKKCAEKNCPKMLEILEKQQVLVKKLTKILSDQGKQKSFAKIKESIIEISYLTEEIAKLNSKKDSLICTFTKCSGEIADVEILRNKLNGKTIVDVRKKLQALKLPKAPAPAR